MTEISIIVPVDNLEQYLENCIESILNQTFKDFELILVLLTTVVKYVIYMKKKTAE